MSKVKQVLAGVLSASMIVTLMPAAVFAEGEAPQGSTTDATETPVVEMPNVKFASSTKDFYGLAAGSLVDVSVVQDGTEVTVTNLNNVKIPYTTQNVGFSSLPAEQQGNYISLAMKITGNIDSEATVLFSGNPKEYNVKTEALDSNSEDTITWEVIIPSGAKNATATFDWDGFGPNGAVVYNVNVEGLELASPYDEAAAATYAVTPYGGTEPFTYTSNQYNTLKALLDDASVVKAGSTVVATGEVETGYADGTDLKKVVKIDLSGATVIRGAMPNADNSENPTYCLNTDAKDTKIYNYAEHKWDESKIVINIPTKYDQAAGHGVTATISCAGNDELLPIKNTKTKYPEGDKTVFNDDYELIVDDSQGKSPTCDVAGTMKLVATVIKKASPATEAATKEYDYGEIPALGHSYGTFDEKTGLTTPVDVIISSGSKAGTYKSIALDFDYLGTGEKVIAHRDENGYTKITSAKVTCKNECGDVVNDDVVSATVTKAVITKQPTTTDAGETQYTVEIVTKDGQTLLMQKTIADIAALGAQTPTSITGVKFLFETYTYDPTDGSYTRDSSPAKYEPLGSDTVTVDWVEVVKDKTYKKLAVAEDGSLSYQLSYEDNSQGGTPKEGTIEGTLAPITTGTTKSQTWSCGSAKYLYNPIETNVYTFVGGKITEMKVAYTTIGFTPKATSTDKSTVLVAGKHTLEDAASYTIEPAPTHKSTGTANIVCKHCGTNIKANFDVTLPASDDHSYVPATGTAPVTSTDAAKVFTIAPSCLGEGYDFYLCEKEGPKALTEAEEKAIKDAGVTLDAAKTYHSVVIESSKKPALGHDYVLVNSTSAGLPTVGAKDTTWKINLGCRNCAVTTEITYHSAAAPASGAEKNHVYEAITVEDVPGADCTKLNSKLYSIPTLTDLNGTVVKASINETTYGAHSYVNTIDWAKDGKTANVTRTCSLGDKCGNHDGKKEIVVNATVTKVENADGSYTYTATYGNEVLGTKTVFDLDDAVITINGGEVIDINAYASVNKTTGKYVYDKTTLKKDIEKAVSVSIKGVVIDPSLYTATATIEITQNETTGLATAATITVTLTANPNTAAEISDKAVPKAISLADAKPQLVANAIIADPTVKINDKDVTTGAAKVYAYNEGVGYNVVAATTTKDVTIKYAIAPYYYTYNDAGERVFLGEEPEAADYTLDAAKLDDAGTYDVWAQLSGKDLTTKYVKLATVTINQLNVGAVVDLGAQIITYGTQLTATTGNADLDARIGLNVADTTKLGVGDYFVRNYVRYNTNYDVTFTAYDGKFTIEKRNATIVMTESSKTYDGKAVDKDTLFTVDGAVEGDDLNVVVNSAGNKDITEVGEYTLVVTANNANYNIDKVTATYTVTPASIAKAKVTLAKTSMKYTGKALKPAVKSVVLNGETLAASNYTVKYANNKNVGTATVTVTGKGNYTGSAKATFKITKAANTLKVTAVSRTAKAATLKTKAVSVAGIKVTGAQGTVTYRKAKGGSKFTVNKTTGKITIKKGVKAGKYTVTESAQAAGNSNYKKSAVKKAKVTITVK